MTTLPTCWYCPECGAVNVSPRLIHLKSSPCIAKSVLVPIIPPGTPLPRILDALGHTYRDGGLVADKPVLVVINQRGSW